MNHPTYYIGKDGHPYYSNGERFRNWNYSKPFIVPPDTAFVPRVDPVPVEIGDYVPSAEEVEKMRKAEEKRARKAAKKLTN